MKINDINIEIKEANSFSKRLMGLMFKKDFKYGLLLKNTNGIHTFFMRENIDVILYDKDFNILYTYNNLKPWRVILPKRGVKHTLEMPSNQR